MKYGWRLQGTVTSTNRSNRTDTDDEYRFSS